MSEQNKPSSENDIRKKFTETLDSLKSHEKMESVVSYAKTHTIDTIAYVALIVGLIWLFWSSFFGGILIGVIAGFYFSDSIIRFIKEGNQLIEKHGLAKSIVFSALLLAILFYLPGIFIGAAISTAISLLLNK